MASTIFRMLRTGKGPDAPSISLSSRNLEGCYAWNFKVPIGLASRAQAWVCCNQRLFLSSFRITRSWKSSLAINDILNLIESNNKGKFPEAIRSKCFPCEPSLKDVTSESFNAEDNEDETLQVINRICKQFIFQEKGGRREPLLRQDDTDTRSNTALLGAAAKRVHHRVCKIDYLHLISPPTPVIEDELFMAVLWKPP
ncbi:hypothetical protein B0H13DRAFT_2265854 [Mycena leptocephala]|nr:hypothetical protein B0H13DRAFT_2265854 [Mycena leptocephala]